jgi:bacteriorhodopsin
MPPVLKYGSLFKDTLFISYLVLLGYTTITLIEAVRTPSINVRNIMNLETTVSLVASIVYGIFNDKMKTDNWDLKDFTKLRYLDWMITTPLIILGLLLFYNQKLASIEYKIFFTMVCFNWLMLLAGYMGEVGAIPRLAGLGLGFGFLISLLSLMVTCCIPSGSNYSAFIVFALLWSLYGVAYMTDDETMNISYNILDVFSKAVFGVALWLFYGKVLNFSQATK